MARYRRERAYGRWAPARVDATGTRRRLQALMTIGHRQTDIAAALGRSVDAVDRYLAGRRVNRATAQAVAALYEQWSGTAGPHADRRTRSHNRGWVPPLGWEGVDIDDPTAQPNLGSPDDDSVDEVAVARALRGEAVKLTDAERLAVAAEVHRRGLGPTALAKALRCSNRTARALLTQAGGDRKAAA